MNRELIPLALARAHSKQPIEGRTRLQKMVFLVQKELENEGISLDSNESYEFWAYDYGPFSKELADEIDVLLGEERLEETEEPFDDGKVKYQYQLLEAGEVRRGGHDRKLAAVIEKAEEIKATYNDMALPKVIDQVYTRYPEYAKNSVY
jgi:uncharacterized protein YwgA